MQRICCSFLDKIIKLESREMDEWIRNSELPQGLSSDPSHVRAERTPIVQAPHRDVRTAG